MKPLKKTAAVYVAKPEFVKELHDEVGSCASVIHDLVFSPETKHDVCFAQDIWLEPHIITFQSISEAATLLRRAGKYWYLHPVTHIRRSRLIEQQLRSCPSLERTFPIVDPIPAIGCFSLLDANTLVYSTKRFKKWPQGQCFFIEDKLNPPNRAYLKLWEALTLFTPYPKPGDTALDLGASPGGWTYVMQSLGAHVTAVDKAPLHASIRARPHVAYLQQSAFALEPSSFEHPIDWVLSDIACYPDRAYTLILKWIASGRAKHMIFTIKLQGKVDLATIHAFQQIPNSRVMQLFHNKHEVTFFYPVHHDEKINPQPHETEKIQANV